MDSYQAGVCNINQKESRKRTLIGLTMLVPMAFFTILVFRSFSILSLAVVWLTGFAAMTGVLQGKDKFCVAHAKSQTFKTGLEGRVKDQEDVEKDDKKANKILTHALVVSTVYTISLTIYVF